MDKICSQVQVKELVLDLYLPSPVLPVEIFHLQSLRRLRLTMNREYLKLPCLGLTNLCRLSLMEAKLPDNPFGGSVLTQCVSLKKLSLIDCFGYNTLNITSSSLEHITILDHPTQGCTVGISRYDNWDVLLPFGSQLLPFFTEAIELELCSKMMQVLVWMMKEKNGISLCRIEILNILTDFSDDEILLIIYILRGFPNLKFLLISREKPNINTRKFLYEKVHKEVQESESVKESLCQLRSARMTFKGTGENNLKLAKYLFNNATGLKKLVMLHLSSDIEIAKEIGRKMKDLAKASPNVEINIEEC